MKPLYLCDYSNMVYRFISVYHVMRDIGGIEYNVSVPYGFIRSLKSNPFKDIHICLDGYPEVSTAILPSYKGQRLKEPTEGLHFPKKELIKFLTKIGEKLNKNIKVVCSAGQEADQVIASQAYQVCGEISPLKVKLANYGRKEPDTDVILQRFLTNNYKYFDIDLSSYDTIFVGTTDSDMYQLLSLENVMIDTSTSGKNFNFGESTPKAVSGIIPSAIAVYKSFVGDTSDNVPAVELHIRKDRLIEVINNHLQNTDLLDKFILAVTRHEKFENKSLQEVADALIKYNSIEKLKLNSRVVRLGFISTPYQIQFEDYDINDTLKKYKLKL